MTHQEQIAALWSSVYAASLGGLVTGHNKVWDEDHTQAHRAANEAVRRFKAVFPQPVSGSIGPL
jgi:hypothetical protein